MTDHFDINIYKKNPKTSFLAGEYILLETKINELQIMIETHPDIKEEAEKEIRQIEDKREALKDQMINILEKSQRSDIKPLEIIVEIRAGAGGEEAALFSQNLFDMYQKYAQNRGWQFIVLDKAESAHGGFKEVIISIKGAGVYDALKHEAGVHRVQRVPATEKMGRIHTSTASVAVLPVSTTASNSQISEKDLEFDFSRSGGAGGQNVNKVETAVRITHIPTGITVRCQSERSQLKNRSKALDILQAKLKAKEEEENELKSGSARREQIGTADRSEKIRTYNFLQDRITDHRIKKSWGNIAVILGGELDTIISAFSRD